MTLPIRYISLAELKNILAARLTEAPSLRHLARSMRISPATLSLLMRHDVAEPRLVKALGYTAVVVYTKVK